MTIPAVRPVQNLTFEEARTLYWQQKPWRYDARFHVPPQHIGLVPVFMAAPNYYVPQAGDDIREDT